jgi:hypothetical protein
VPELHTATVVAHANANLARDPRRTQTRQLACVHPAGTLGLVIMHKCLGRMDTKMQSGLSTDFSMVRIPNRVLKPLKSASFRNPDCIFFLSILPKSSFGMDTIRILPFLCMTAVDSSMPTCRSNSQDDRDNMMMFACRCAPVALNSHTSPHQMMRWEVAVGNAMMP